MPIVPFDSTHTDGFRALVGDTLREFGFEQDPHYDGDLDDPAAAIDEAARLLAPGGRLIVVDFAAHSLDFLREDFAHRRLGFSPAASFPPIAILRLATTSPGRGRESHGRGCSPTRVTIYPPVKPAFGQGKRHLLEENLFMAK